MNEILAGVWFLFYLPDPCSYPSPVLLNSIQPQQFPWGSDTPSSFPPQGLCTCCSLWGNHSLGNPHVPLPRVLAQKSPLSLDCQLHEGPCFCVTAVSPAPNMFAECQPKDMCVPVTFRGAVSPFINMLLGMSPSPLGNVPPNPGGPSSLPLTWTHFLPLSLWQGGGGGGRGGAGGDARGERLRCHPSW